MRITAHRMLELAAQSTSKAESDVADLSGHLTSGKRVERPSDDPVAWTHARRLELRRTVSEGRGDGLGLAKDQLDQTEQALGTISGLVAQAQQYAIQGARVPQRSRTWVGTPARNLSCCSGWTSARLS